MAQRSAWSGALEFLICETGFDTGAIRGVALPITMAYPDEGKLIVPTFRLGVTAAQELMDNLWSCGLRPSEGTGSAGALAATERHLQDMRKLVFAVDAESQADARRRS